MNHSLSHCLTSNQPFNDISCYPKGLVIKVKRTESSVNYQGDIVIITD